MIRIGSAPRIHAPRGHPGFATRLLIAQTLVLVAGAITSWLVAVAVGPGIFRDHLQRAGITHGSAEMTHIEEAFTSALIISFLVALLASVTTALGVAWYLTLRVRRSITAVADSAAGIAQGRYRSRVPRPGLGGEFDQLAATFNQLAERLDTTEIARRRMLADLGHEMRTPLASLNAYLEALEDGVRELDEPTLAVLRSNTQRLGRLAQDISAVSRAEEGRLEITPAPADPPELVQSAALAAADRYRAKGVSLVLDSGAAPAVSVDRERMGQVFGNLLDNALRHTPTGGTVTIGCRSSTDSTSVEFTVRDSGDGIESAHLQQIFDRFYRADTARDQQHGGSGIGLTIARALVEAHGGSISADSPGRDCGATFTVRLPIVAG